jgi:hypothetical protein
MLVAHGIRNPARSPVESLKSSLNGFSPGALPTFFTRILTASPSGSVKDVQRGEAGVIPACRATSARPTVRVP